MFSLQFKHLVLLRQWKLNRVGFSIDDLKVCLRIFVVVDHHSSPQHLFGNEEHNSDTYGLIFSSAKHFFPTRGSMTINFGNAVSISFSELDSDLGFCLFVLFFFYSVVNDKVWEFTKGETHSPWFRQGYIGHGTRNRGLFWAPANIRFSVAKNHMP